MNWNLGTLTSWNPLGLSRPVRGLLYYNEQWLPVEVTHASSRRDTKEEVITLIPYPTGIPLVRLTILTLGELVSQETTAQTASLVIFRRSKRTMFISSASRSHVWGQPDTILCSNETWHKKRHYMYAKQLFCLGLPFLIGTSILHGLPETQPLLRSWQSFSWPSVLYC
jgi:hypothetical protein